VTHTIDVSPNTLHTMQRTRLLHTRLLCNSINTSLNYTLLELYHTLRELY